MMTGEGVIIMIIIMEVEASLAGVEFQGDGEYW